MTVLDNHLRLLSEEAEAAVAAEDPTHSPEAVQELVDVAMGLYRAVSRRAEIICPRGAWSEEGVRRAAPLIQKWYALATKVLVFIRAVESRKVSISGKDEFIFAYLACRPVATDLEGVIESQKKWLSGDRSAYRPMEEVFDELRREDCSGGRKSGQNTP